jgi:hypothetical protein
MRIIALTAPLPLEGVFDPSIDVGEPYDRTAGASPQRRS